MHHLSLRLILDSMLFYALWDEMDYFEQEHVSLAIGTMPQQKPSRT